MHKNIEPIQNRRFRVKLMSYIFALFGITLAAITLVAPPGAAQTPNVLLQQNQAIDTDINPEEVIIWDGLTANQQSDGNVKVQLRLRTERNFTIYLDKVNFYGPSGTKLEKIDAPKPMTILDPISRENVQVYHGGEFELTYSLEEPNTLKDSPYFLLDIKFIGCTQVICLFPHTTSLKLPLIKVKPAITDSATTTKFESPGPALTKPEPEPNKEKEIGVMDLEQELAKHLQDKSLPIWAILIFVFLGGVLTNLTPCVYPMIPITIRLLSNQSSKPVYGATAYASGIFMTYTALGIFAKMTGTMFGQASGGATFNIIVGCVMFLLALSMIGFGNFTFLQNLGNKIGTGKPSMRNAFLMGTGAGLVASPCTGPVLAFLLFYTASLPNEFYGNFLLATYSLGFAIPYVILGSAASTITKVKIPPNIQILVKLVFAAVISALGFFYLRIPLYPYIKGLSQHWLTFAQMGITLGITITFLIMIAPKMRTMKVFHVIQAYVLGFGLFSLTQYISIAEPKLDWIRSEAQALKEAEEKNMPILIDAWAEWCVACKKMDVTTFQHPKVIEYIQNKKWLLLKLDLTEYNDKTEKLQEKYNIGNLPTLILLPPSGKPIDASDRILSYVNEDELIERLKAFDLKYNR